MKPPKLTGAQVRTLAEIGAAPDETVFTFRRGTVKAADQLVQRAMLSRTLDPSGTLRGWRLTPYGRQALLMQDRKEAARGDAV
jgi:hypothetical protein